MAYEIYLSPDVEEDLLDIFEYISKNDSFLKAQMVLDRIEAAIHSLAELPFRGLVPSECLLLGVKKYREIFFKPYRIFYEITPEQIQVVLVTDGRRDILSLLQRRLLND